MSQSRVVCRVSKLMGIQDLGDGYAEFFKPCVFCFTLNVYFGSFLVVLGVFLLFLLARLAIPLEIMSKVGLREDTLISTRST